ncbi:MAG: transcriptional regulator [Pseudomonadota bacterium]
MPLTKRFVETVKERANRDPDFRRHLLEEALETLTSGDLAGGKTLLRDYVNATIGFPALADELGKDPKNLMRMLSEAGNPRADTLFPMVARLKEREGVGVQLSSLG